MDSDAMASPLGAWASIRGYFTPATLFLVLNLVIGTIALTSRSRDQRRRRELHHYHNDYAHLHHPQHGQHDQEPVLHDPLHQPQQQHEYGHHYFQQQQEYATPPPPPAPLARTSSVLDRLRSIGLYRFRSGDFPPEYGGAGTVTNHHDASFAQVEEEEAAKQYARSRSEPAPAREEGSRAAPPRVKKKAGAATEVVRKSQATRAPVARVVEAVAEDDEVVLDARAEEFIGGLRQHEPASPPQKAEYYYQEAEYVPPAAPMRAPPPLSRTSSVLDRLRSLGLYNFLAADQPAAPAIPSTDAFAAAAPVTNKKQAPVPAAAHYDRSRSEPVARQQAGNNKEKKQQAAPTEAKMAKSSSSTARKASPSLVSQPSVNTRAEAFIDSFRKGQSLKQQPHHAHHDEDDDEHVVSPPPAPLARTSSVLDRLRSFSLYLRPGDPAVPEDPYKTPAVTDEKTTKQAAPQHGRSRSEPARDQVGKKKKTAQQGISKTSSETNIAEEEAPAEECVDARADDFINKFRQQLQLQRLNSLLSYGGAKQ